MTHTFTIYSKSHCPNCETAKRLLQARRIDFTEINLDEEARRTNFMLAYPEAKGMPQIFIGEQRVGGVAGLRTALEQLGL